MSLFSKMRIYTVHIKPEEQRAPEKPLFVREGFNIFAFLFTFAWAFSQRLWIQGLLILIFNFCMLYLDKHHLLGQVSLFAIQLGVQVFVGFQANDWKRASLAKRGFTLCDIATGENLLRSQQRYFERMLAAR